MILYHGSDLTVSEPKLVAQNRFLDFIVPKIVGLIVKNHGVDEVTAARKLYESKVYSLLEEEDTKLWHLSPLTLFHMYDEEIKTGNITFPEE